MFPMTLSSTYSQHNIMENKCSITSNLENADRSYILVLWRKQEAHHATMVHTNEDKLMEEIFFSIKGTGKVFPQKCFYLNNVLIDTEQNTPGSLPLVS